MSISRKFQRSKSKYTLSQKIISAVTAAGFIMQPIVGFAQSINKVNNNGSIEVNGNVTNIWADKVVSNSAVNVFKDFQLDANNIANMYFNTKGASGADAANLVNFVNSRIDINGTVNAVQNSQIGGNLFFLSKEGMAVGKSGVINTGSLYVMTPTPDFMEAVQTVGTEAPAEDANKYLGYITNITDPTKANAWEIIPVNTSGTITVLGKVNATNEVQMRAAKIGVGKNVDDQVVDEVASGDTVSAASITTGVTNFGDLVNIKGVDGAEDVKSGLTGELTATQTGSGDIVLSAYVDGATEKNNLEELPVVGATLGPIAETVENTFVEQDFNASVDVYGTVATGVETTEKKGNININATAVNSNADFNEQINDYELNDNDVAQLANVKAEVNIDGAVKAAEDVTVKAEAINRYIDNSGSVAKGASLAVGSVTPITGDIAYSVLNTEANVNITSEGSIVSDNGNVDIDAKAETLAASAASVTALKFKAAGGTTGANVPAVSVLYTGADNKANVTVEGNVKAAENISIDADADMKVDAENKMGIKGKMGNQFVVGVTVAGAENSASVDIVDIKDEDNSNNVINAGNDLSVNANATSDFTSGTSIKAPEASAMAVAVNVTDFNSNANVNIDTDLTAGNDLTVKADNIITDDNVIAESTIGSGKYVSAATQVVTGHVEQKKGEVKDFISGLAAKLGKDKKLPIGDDDDIPGLQLSEIFKAGATVTYSGQKHDSSVTIGKNASLKANEGKLDIGAMTKIEDAHITATGTTSSYNDAYPAELTVNAAVLVNNMDNSSSVVVADRDAESTEPTLSGKNGVSVNASTRFEYNRIKNMIQDVKDAANQIASAVGGLDGSIKNDFDGFINTLNKQIDAWESAFSTADETLATSDEGVLAIGEAATAGYNVLTALNNLNTMLDNSGSEVAADTKAAIQGASDLLTSALAFADPNSYGNFAASSASKGSSGDTGSIAGHHSSAVNGAGTVMVNTVNSVSKVEIGSNAVINAVGKVELNAENYMKDVSLGGLNAVPLTNSGGGTAASIGATVNYSDFNTDTVVAVNDGAAISGGDINIAGSNEIDHVSVAGSAGMGPSDETESNGIVLNGMLSFVDGSSDILTVVDDGAELTANAQKQYTETVKDEETGEETEVTKTSEGNISISGHNDTNIVNVAAGLNLGSGSGAVGVGLAYNDFAVKNIAGVADVAEQIKNLYSYKDDNGEVAVDDSKVAELDGELNNTYTASSDTNTKGSISAYSFDVDAATEGSIQSVSVAASASKNDDTGEVSFFGKIKGGISKVENDLLGTGGKLDRVTGKIFGTESGKANEMFNKGSSSHGTGGGIKLVGSTSGKGGFMPSFSIAGSGSVSLNSLNNATEAVVDNVNITMQPTSNKKGDISVTARDTLYAGAYSGAAALQWKSGGSSSDKAVGFAGAAGVNDIDNVVKAVVKESTIENAGKFNTMALSGGEQLALGLGLAVEKTGSTSGYSGNAAVSVNLIDHEVEALHENNTVKETEDVNVSAYARDIENTGGGSLGAGQQKVGVGATVGVAMLNNNITAGIKGGKYENVGNVDVEALNALQNITVGIAAGLTLPSSGSGASAVVEGAGVYNEVHNTTNAFIEGNGSDDKVVITTVDGGIVDVIAQDVAITEDSIYEQALDGLADGKTEIAERMGSDFDITGASELNGIETDDIKAQLNNKDAEGTGTQSNENSTEEVNLNKDGGSSIITVAGGLAATTGKGAGGAAVAITDIENNYTANVEYAQITAEELNAEAGSDSNIVTVSGGIAAASKGSGVGSVTWNDVENTANVNIVNSSVKAQQTAAKASNTAQIISVAGQISGAGKAGVGATLSYIGLDNSTEANITSTTFDKSDNAETEGITVTADAENRSDSYNVAAGVSAAGTAAVSGNVAVTQTHGTSGAVIDSAIINNAKAVSANALDDTDILSVIGTVSAAGTASVGAGVAYTEIGSTSTDEVDAQQTVAAIENTDITTAASTNGSTVSAQATDSSKVINVAVGIGGAGTAAVQGASATSLINKTTGAELTNTNIDKDSANSQNANVTVDAQNNSEITSSADVASVAGTAGVGAGVAVNRIVQNTNAAVNGGTMHINNLTVNANGTPRIENIGIGVGAGGTAGVAGSVAVNMIANNVTAHIGNGANIVAGNNVGVIATSDEQIANYVGSASVAGTGAAVGASVSVNKITGTTSATVGDENTDTKVTAKGNGSDLTSNTIIDKNTINNALIDNDTVDIDSHIARGKESRKGLIVDASSTRDMKSFLINASVAGEGAGVTGTVNVNMIDGATEAGITDTVVNGGSTAIAGQNANVFVNAGDYTNSSGFVGGASVAGIGGGVGLASDTNTVERTTSAIIEDSDIKADKFEVDADSMQGVSSFTVSAGVAGIGAGVSGVVSVTDLKNTTQAAFFNSKVTADTVDIKATHKSIINAGNVGVGAAGLGAGVGLSVGVLKDNSETRVDVGDNEITLGVVEESEINAEKDVNVAATNNAVVKPVISATGAGAAGAAGAISINNINSVVKTNINHADINSKQGNITGNAQNAFDIDAYMGGNAAGAFGSVGVSVTVNTIDSTIQTNVTDSELTAENGDITLTAEETRNIEQIATNVSGSIGVSAGANIAITNVGEDVENDENSNAADKIAEANNMYSNNDGNDIGSLMGGASDALNTARINDAVPTIGAGYGGDKDSQITVNITNSNIKADNNVTAKATETDNITMTLGSGSAGMAAVNAGVGILNVHRNVGVNITGGNITAAKAVELASVINGSSNLDVYQGTAGILGVNAAYGGATSDGTSGVTISSGTIDGGSINILAEDAGRTDVDAIGLNAGVVSAGAIVAEGTNESQTSVNISDTEMNSVADIDIKAERQAKDSEGNTTDAEGNKYASLNINATAGIGGLLGAGAGLGAVAEEKGSVKVNISGISNTLTAGEALNINAFNAPVVNVSATSGAGSLIAAASVTYAKANIDMDTEVNVDGYNTTLAAGSDKDKNEGINISAEADAAQNVEMEAIGVAIGGAGQANAAEVNITSDVKVDIAGNTAFKANVEKENVDVNIKADNTATQSANAYGLAASGLVASGTNLGKTNSNLTTTVDLKGSWYDSGIDNLTANAHSKVDISNYVNGDGGALLDVSPYAAKTENSVISNTNVNIGGSWDITGDMDVEALHENEIDLNADALKAAVAGLSGVHANNKIENNTGVKFNNATVNSDGSQKISARNTIDYTNVVKGSGYGAANVTAVWAEDDLDLKTNVSIEKSELKAEKSITVDALTGDEGYNPDGEPVASVDKEVTIKSAGVIAGTDAISTDNIDFINNIKVDKDSSVATVGKEIASADITFTAADRTNFTDIVTADTQGGVVGASGSVLNNNFNRKNTITVEGFADNGNSYTVDSNHDANFDAGNTSVLNLTLKSNAYNKTAAPIATNPTINGIMKLTSSINFTAGKAVESLRNINVAAGEGDTTIAKESKMWRWVTGGETGTGSVASTVDGVLSSTDANVTTSVTVDGELVAGKNNELTITITDNTTQEAALKDAIEDYNGGEAFGTAEGALIAAQKAYDEVVKKEGGLEDKSQQLAEKQKEYENNKTAYDIFAAQDVTISANLEEAGNNLTNAQNALSTAKVALEGWINEKLEDYNDNYKPSISQDIDRETFIEGLTDATTAWYALYHTDYDKQTDNIANIERQINGDGTAANPGLQAIYNDYAAQKESNDANLAAFDIVALEQQIEQLNNEIEGIVGGADYIAVKEALDTAKVNYYAALEEGFSEENINANIFGNAGSDKYVSIEASPWFEDLYGSPAEKIGMAAYASALLERYGQLADMMQEYAGTEVSKTYSGEMTRIQRELIALGVGRVDDNGIFAVTANSIVPTIELEDLTVSGGDINISGGSLNGSGAMTANGNPILTIDNQSNFFLKVNNITVDNDGGSIVYNNTSINGRHGDIIVNADTGGNGAQVNISSSNNVKASESQYYTPDIGVYGTIYNPYGDITIYNQNNSIYVAGEVDGDTGVLQEAGSVKGRTVTLTAGGSVTQGYSDGITDVAGDPKNALDEKYIAAIQAALIDKLTDAQKIDNGKYYAAFNTVGKLAQFLTGLEVGGKTLDSAEALEAAKQLTGQIDDGRAGITAGGAIYINAASINVNGKIQSGYEDYKLNLNQEKAQELISKGNTLGQENLPDAQFKTDEYLVTTEKNGAYYDNNTCKFVYGVKAWYNPTTGQIFTEDIEQAGGGRIYLTGAIANTNTNTNAGGGKLIVLDGGSNYDINSTVKDMDNQFTLKLGSINAATVDGRIEINDTNTAQTTIYTKGDVTTDENGKRVATYNPKGGQYYIWSNGTANRVTVTYEHVSDTSWFGLSEDKWEETIGSLDEVTKDNMQVGITESKDEMLPTVGNIISDGSVNGYHKLDNVAGSSDKNAGTLYQIAFERQGKPKQGVNANGDLLYWGKDEDGNQILVTNDTGSPYYLKNNDGTYVYETVISNKVTNTENKDPLGWWGKTVTTRWKETSGMITAYNFGLKADNSIGIEFVGQAEGSTGTIKSNSDILLGGDIHMGQVDITSTTGSIGHIDDATVISDNATFNAQTGIDVIVKNEANPSKLNGTDTLGLDGEELGNPLHLKATTTTGNINIQAVAANEYKDVYIDNVSTGAGNVTITAEGSLLNGNIGTNGYAVKGDGITLQSYGGNIGSSEENGRLLIDGDVSYVADSDKNHGAINANAAGSVYLTEVNGNMYLGEIVAEDGNVVLEVTGDGAGFVDAIVNNSNDNKDDSRIEEWTKLGLLGADTVEKTQNNKVNQLTNLENAAKNGSMFMDEEGTVSFELAQEQGTKLVETGDEFVNLMKGGRDDVQEAREDLNAAQGALNEAIAALGDDDTSEQNYKNALEAYNSAYDNYEKVGAEYEQQKANFIENSGFKDNAQAVEWLYNYEAIGNAETDNYGWTQQQLLYAVQDTVINPEAGSVSDVKTANVTGNNITFISDTGNLGVVDDQASSIETGKLTKLFSGKEEDETGFLQKLASARAGDVTWGKDEITIKRTTPVSVKLNGDNGTVTVENSSGGTPVAKHIYLLAKDSVLNADEFAANDLRLSGQEGINVNKVTGNKIILEGGSGNIDALDKTLQAVQVTLNDIKDTTTGKVVNGFVSANATGNIMLEQVGTGNFTLGSVAGTNVDITANGNIVSKADDIGYINASGTINLTSEDGGIGTTTKGLRIKNSGAVVNTDVQDAVNIEAVQDGTLVLGEIKQESGGVTVESEGTIMLGREDDATTTEDESVTGSIDAKDDVTLHAEDDIIISGKLHVNATDEDTASDKGTLQLHSNTGDIVQTTDKEDKNIVAANVGIAAVGGDVELYNPYNIIKKVDLQAVGGSLGLTVSNHDGFNVDMGGFTNKQGGDIKLTNNDGSVNITTEDIVNSAQKDPANINGSLIVTADKGNKATKANVNNYGILNATRDISFNAEDNVNNEEAVNAGADVNFGAGNDVNNESTVSAGADVSFGAGNDVNNESAVNAGTDVSFGAGNDIINNAIVDAGRNVNFNAAEDIYNNSNVNADETIEFTAVDGVINSDTVNGKDVIMQAIEQELENILAKDSVTLNGDRIHGQNITQNTDADGDLIINTDSDSGSGPIESLVIDKIDANDKSVFTELWAVEADITTVDDKMDFNDIMIEENAWLENSGTLATIYGNVPIKDDDANVHIYQSYPSMYVNFIDADTVETDGRLLSLDDYWYAYDQRFTAENHLRWQHGRYLDEDWKQAYGYGLSLHNRYGLIDYQEFTETNAGADEVAVEA